MKTRQDLLKIRYGNRIVKTQGEYSILFGTNIKLLLVWKP